MFLLIGRRGVQTDNGRETSLAATAVAECGGGGVRIDADIS
jgi:hypothetical protein